MKDKRIVFLLAFLILGVLLSLQFRSTLSSNKKKALNRLDIEEVVSQIEEEKRIQSELKEKIEANIRDMEVFYNAYFENRNDTSLKSELESIRLKAGFVDVIGSGVTIILDDAPSKQEGDVRNQIIHDQDIREILNELKCAGAQAISINGERIVAMSELVCAGPTILINKNRYAVPYIINVIGDPDALYEAADNSVYIALMRNDGIRVEIKKSDEVLVPRFMDIFDDDLIKNISGLEVVKNENN